MYNLFEYLPKRRMPNSEDANLKVPYFHNYLSLLGKPELWHQVWDIEKVKAGPSVSLPDDLPPVLMPSSGTPKYQSDNSSPASSLYYHSPNSPQTPSFALNSSPTGNRWNTSSLALNDSKSPGFSQSAHSKLMGITKMLSWEEYLN
ncbi:hypothetical protein GEMRC1_008421 [Eukaryota sp. GEM-RC1]